MDPETERKSTRHPLAALCITVPAPSLGLLAYLYFTPGPAGQSVFALSKVWLLVVPILWLKWVDREPWRVSRPTGRGLVIYLAYLFVRPAWLDAAAIRSQASEAGFSRPGVFIAGALYWCLVNSLLEEYVWRWFVFCHCEQLVRAAWAAPLSAALFTVHHVFGLAAYVDWQLTLLGSLGVFTGGWVWSACFRKFRSVWPGYLSHLVVDAVIFRIGWQLLFGA